MSACPVRDPNKSCPVVKEKNKEINIHVKAFERIQNAYARDKKFFRIVIGVEAIIIFSMAAYGAKDGLFQAFDWVLKIFK